MNERMAKIEQKVENIEQGIDRIEKALTEHIKWEDNKYESMGEKFSGKWVEKAFIGLLMLFVASLMGIIAAL